MAGTVIIGAGQAASQLVASLRTEGYAAPITVVGDEAYPPYQRPPLSKEYLAGDKAFVKGITSREFDFGRVIQTFSSFLFGML